MPAEVFQCGQQRAEDQIPSHQQLQQQFPPLAGVEGLTLSYVISNHPVYTRTRSLNESFEQYVYLYSEVPGLDSSVLQSRL